MAKTKDKALEEKLSMERKMIIKQLKEYILEHKDILNAEMVRLVKSW